jgi:hypothetical protein
LSVTGGYGEKEEECGAEMSVKNIHGVVLDEVSRGKQLSCCQTILRWLIIARRGRKRFKKEGP